MTEIEELQRRLHDAHESADKLRDALHEARGEMTAWAAQALNCKQALAALLRAGAILIPIASWNPTYRDAVMRAGKCLAEASK